MHWLPSDFCRYVLFPSRKPIRSWQITKPSHVFSANITKKTSLNALSTSECLSIDRVCLLSACPETYAEFFHSAVLIISDAASYRNAWVVLGSVAGGGTVQVPNCPPRFPDGTGPPQMSGDSWNSCARCPRSSAQLSPPAGGVIVLRAGCGLALRGLHS